MTHAHSRRRSLVAASVALCAAALAVGPVQLPAGAAPSSEQGESARHLGDTPPGFADRDVRGTARVSAAQKQAARALGASARWNDFGTPASLLPADGSLGSASGSAVQAARSWLRGHRAVLGLDGGQVDDLTLVNDQRLAGSKAHAVLFRQHFGGLTPAVGGMVTVGVKGGRIAYVSSSLVKNADTTPPAAALSPQAGWLEAVAAVADATGLQHLGLDQLPTSVGSVTQQAGWTRFLPTGFTHEQQARVRGLAMADGEVRPVIEANVVNVAGARAAAYTVLVDASAGTGQGEVLWSHNQVEQLTDASTVTPVLADDPAKLPFQGETGPTAGDCGPRHEFEVTDDETRTILVSATAVNVANDIVVKLYGPDGDLITSGDTGTSPEVASATAEPFEQGTYAAQVCLFDDPTVPPTPPYNYVGNVALFSQGTGSGAGLPYPPRWSYFTTNPTPRFDTEHTPDNEVTGCWTISNGNDQPAEGCTEPAGPLRNLGSRSPWDVVPTTELPSFTTLGNNASDREAWASPLTPGGTARAPFSATREYTTEFEDQWNNSRCNPAEFAEPNGADVLFSAQNLFVSHNKMHDFAYFLGFNEGNYNLQLSNYGNGGVAGDPEIGNVQAGAATAGQPTFLGRDNANQITLQDGIPGITNQYLFQPIAGSFYAPCADGGLDMGIVGHEYTHAISNRMIGGPDEGITSEQGGAMGESWGDLVAGEFQFSHGYDNGGNIWAVGLYATGNLRTAIRDYALDDNPLTYGEYGFDVTGPEVHADGEIWNATQWRVRQSLVDKYDGTYPYSNRKRQLACSQGQPNYGPVQPSLCPGNRRWIQIMFDAFLLQQGATDMLQARDAMIAADQLRFNGADKAALWRAFARSGMGTDARTPDADSGDVTPGFAAPSGNRTVRFHPRLPNGDRVRGRIYIGTYEARATPVADTLAGTDLDATAPMTPGTYPGLVQSDKTGLQRFTLKVTRGGDTLVKRIGVRTNYASSHNGAAVTDSSEGSLNPEWLIDDTEATNWGGVADGNVDDSGNQQYVTVDLAGDRAVTLRRAVVSAMLRPAESSGDELPLAGADDPDSGSRFTALRKFRIDVCTTACTADGTGWRTAYTSPSDAFPSTRPRPVAPTLNARTFTFPAVTAKYVRLVALENQCTGYAGYAGEQDDDPTNDTDCKSASDRGTIVHAAELEVFDR